LLLVKSDKPFKLTVCLAHYTAPETWG